MPNQSAPPLYFGPMSAQDQRLRFVDLSDFFPTGDAQSGTPTATILAIAGDTSPLTLVGSPTWDTGPREVFTGPYAAPYQSLGPRIMMTLTGGTKGSTYTILVTWQDTAGQTTTRPVYQYVQWDATG